MKITIDLQLIANAILVVLGIIAIIFLILFLKNASDLLKSVKKVVDKNSNYLDDAIEKIPGLVNEANRLVGNINDIASDPNLKMAISKANDTITNVSIISEDVRDTVNYFGETAIDSADTFGEGISSITDYASMIKDVVDIVRSVIAGR